MPVLTTLDIPVHITGGFPQPDIDIRIVPRYSGAFDPTVFDPSLFDIQWSLSEQAQIAITIDATRASAALPRASREQIIPPWRVQVGATEIPWYRLLSGISVSESIEGITTFSFSAPRRGSLVDPYTEPLGSPLSWLGVPGGKQPITITAEFLTTSGRQSVPLVRDGILDNSSSSVSPSGDTRSWNGGGAHARIDKNPVTYQAPPGHGQTSGTIVRRLLTLAGVDPAKIAISGGRRMYKAISLIDAPVIQSINDILVPESKKVYHDDRSDTWRLHDRTNVGDKRVECIITESDVLSVLGQLGDEASTDSPTSIVLTSTAQATREECGRHLEYKVIDSFGIRGVRAWKRFQVPADGSLDGIGQRSLPAELRRIKRQVIVCEFDCDTLISLETVTWGWFVPEAARYKLDSTGVIAGWNSGYIYDVAASVGDESPLYAWPSERWTVTSWSREERSFDDRSYLTRMTTRKGGWAFQDAPLKARVAFTDSWETEPFDLVWITAAGRPVTSIGFGDGMRCEEWYGPTRVYGSLGLHKVYPKVIYALSGIEIFFDAFGNVVGASQSDLETQITNYSVEGGFINEEESLVFRYLIRESGRGTHLYQNAESLDAIPSYSLAERQVTTYGAVGESSHDELWARYSHDGTTLEREERFGVDGYLPVAEQRTDIVPPASTYDDPAEHEFALAASRHENRPLKVEVSAPALESVLPIWTMKGVSVEYAENEDDLYATGIQMFRDLTAITVNFPMPFNPLLRPGHRVILSLPTIGWYYDLIIETSTHTQDDRATWTQIVSRADVI